MNPETLYKEAVALHRQGRLAEAEPLYARVMAAAPENFSTRYMFALLRFQQQRASQALEAVDAALALNPQAPDALVLKGILLQQAGEHALALASFDRAAALRPRDPGIWFHRGMVLREVGQAEAALESHARAIELKPDHADAWYQHGALLQGLGRLDAALESYDRAVAINPSHAEAWSNRGAALLDLKRPLEALSSLDQALAAAPARPEIWHNRGTALRDLKRPDEALAAYDRALALKPDLAPALNNRSAILWKEKRNYHDAVADLERLLRIAPDYDYAPGLLLHLKMHGADWTNFDKEVAAIHEGVRAGKPVVQPFVYQAIATSPADLQACSVHYANRLYPPLPPLALAGNRGHGKIRLAYMSGEMRAQAIGFLMAGVFEHHDREAFELTILDNGWDDGSPTRRRIEKSADQLIDITQMTDKAVADLICEREIDILVNLNGYFGAVRMGIFAARPAPIQVNYLGLPATLGAPYIDYIVADRIVIPESERQFYTERVVHLPDTYWPTDNRQAIALQTPGRAACGLPEDAFVFCNFNQSYKLTPGMFDIWMHILKDVPHAVLWLLDSYDAFAPNLRREAESLGIAGERLIFARHADPDRHLARIKCADLALDSLPYNMHTTGWDVLWAGVPLITRPGTTFPGRVAASLLNAAGFSELICPDLPAYCELAIALARDPERLQGLRAKLARNRLAAPLFDTARFTHMLESAYRRMWDLWRDGRPAQSFSV
jgi:predicted O-linked N-acetylglucosamine transferase (SPINDLY family)